MVIGSAGKNRINRWIPQTIDEPILEPIQLVSLSSRMLSKSCSASAQIFLVGEPSRTRTGLKWW